MFNLNQIKTKFKFLAFISGYVFIEPTLANFLSDNFKMTPGTIGIVFAIVYVTCIRNN